MINIEKNKSKMAYLNFKYAIFDLFFLLFISNHIKNKDYFLKTE